MFKSGSFDEKEGWIGAIGNFLLFKIYFIFFYVRQNNGKILQLSNIH